MRQRSIGSGGPHFTLLSCTLLWYNYFWTFSGKIIQENKMLGTYIPKHSQNSKILTSLTAVHFQSYTLANCYLGFFWFSSVREKIYESEYS